MAVKRKVASVDQKEKEGHRLKAFCGKCEANTTSEPPADDNVGA
jgi:hypothetical protein